MNNIGEQWVQKGWQCPVCNRVYSPTTVMCLYCGNPNVKTEGKPEVTSYSDKTSEYFKERDWKKYE